MGALSDPREGLLWFEQCLAAGVADAPAPLRAQALGATSSLAYLLGDLDPALDAGLEALALCHEIENSRGIGSVLTQLAMITRDFGHYAEAESYSDEAVAVGRRTGFAPLLGGALMIKSFIAFDHGDFDSARVGLPRGTRITRPPATSQRRQKSSWSSACTAFAEGGHVAAGNWFQEAADIRATASQDPAVGLAVTALALGDHARAREIREEALELIRDTGRGPPRKRPGTTCSPTSRSEKATSTRPTAFSAVASSYTNSTGRDPGSPRLAGFARIALARGDPERCRRAPRRQRRNARTTRNQCHPARVAPTSRHHCRRARGPRRRRVLPRLVRRARSVARSKPSTTPSGKQPLAGLSGQPDDTQP